MGVEAMNKYRVGREDEPDLAFTGKVLANVDNHEISGDRQNCWDEFTVYETEDGLFVAQIEYHSRWQDDFGTSRAKVFEDINDITGYFGFVRLAKELYKDEDLVTRGLTYEVSPRFAIGA